MNVRLPTHMDKPAFLAWLDRVEEHYELVGGRVVMMVRPARAHGIIVRNLLLILHTQLDPRQWTVLAEFGLAAEVLSPSTAAIDLGDKAAEYLQLPSLAAYLVFAQDEVKAWTWVRGAQSFPSGPDVIAGTDKSISIAALGLNLPLAEIYAGLGAS
jgi:Uma2 family endonuclease